MVPGAWLKKRHQKGIFQSVVSAVFKLTVREPRASSVVSPLSPPPRPDV